MRSIVRSIMRSLKHEHAEEVFGARYVGAPATSLAPAVGAELVDHPWLKRLL
ncbi:MAG: hypothetical protein ACI9KE_006388, partial [Polyangiales bacterium]